MQVEANDRQVGGTHYGWAKGMQPWDVVVALDLDFFQGNILKYIYRRKGDSRLEDLEKAKHYLQKYIEVERAREDYDAGRTSQRPGQAGAEVPQRVLVHAGTERDGGPGP